eukprot:TRINITY_DN18730_c1_g1_i1.p1 TRINITY_DN18730_c1_g1~~TRINITY_DN18730_c1_g1_i1.p1  ORF type:complete len:365 (-),score=-22.41 TRINITY_DN18730_c1_g1_i1:288-1382(-)
MVAARYGLPTTLVVLGLSCLTGALTVDTCFGMGDRRTRAVWPGCRCSHHYQPLVGTDSVLGGGLVQRACTYSYRRYQSPLAVSHSGLGCRHGCSWSYRRYAHRAWMQWLLGPAWLQLLLPLLSASPWLVFGARRHEKSQAFLRMILQLLSAITWLVRAWWPVAVSVAVGAVALTVVISHPWLVLALSLDDDWHGCSCSYAGYALAVCFDADGTHTVARYRALGDRSMHITRHDCSCSYRCYAHWACMQLLLGSAWLQLPLPLLSASPWLVFGAWRHEGSQACLRMLLSLLSAIPWPVCAWRPVAVLIDVVAVAPTVVISHWLVLALCSDADGPGCCCFYSCYVLALYLDAGVTHIVSTHQELGG